MSDKFTVSTTKSFSNIFSNSLAGLLIGIVLFFLSFFLLWKNEGNFVKNLEINNFVLKNTKNAAINSIDPNMDNELIHLQGPLIAKGTIGDELGIEVNDAILLNRTVLIYQWKESRNSKEIRNSNGSVTTETEYTYSKTWSENLINSSNFANPTGHQNPTTYPIASRIFYAKSPKLGKYNITKNQISIIRNLTAEELGENPSQNQNLPQTTKEIKTTKYNNYYYIGNNPNSPNIGDIKITYSYVPSPLDITIIGKQIGNYLMDYTIDNKYDFFYISTNLQSLNKVVDILNQDNTTTTWIFRILLFFMMFIGLLLIIKPIHLLTRFIPFLGSIFNGVTIILAFFIALGLSTITVAIAWLRFRPLISIILIIIIATIFPTIKHLFKKKQTLD